MKTSKEIAAEFWHEVTPDYPTIEELTELVKDVRNKAYEAAAGMAEDAEDTSWPSPLAAKIRALKEE